jgi:hypothetical protein
VARVPVEVPRLVNPEPDVSGRPRTSTDVALLQVVHMVLDEDWSPGVAADRLVKRVDGDFIVLRHARARVLRGATERTSGITERALVTLNLALRKARRPLTIPAPPFTRTRSEPEGPPQREHNR